jgi:RND family efflux transporter MFP subunit
MPSRPAPAWAVLFVLGAALGLLAGCNSKTETAAVADADSVATAGAASAAGPAASSPPVGVTTVRATQRDLPVLITATGSVAPLSSVDVRAQTTSLVAQVHVKEGQFVGNGQLLFTLDARADEANVAKARAQMARDEAALADAQRQLKRSQDLLAQNFISQGAVDTNLTAVQSQQAAVTSDKAALDAARLGLSYTRITAPSAGRLGAINVFPGSSVQANQTSLVSITQLDPITVSFSLPQRHLADALAALKNGGAAVSVTVPESAGAPATPASAAETLAGNVIQGRLKFVDNAVDPTTGTVKVKAEFNNRDGKLWPGAFVNVAMTARTLSGAVVVPMAAIIQSARGPIVYTVRDNVAQPRPVQVLVSAGDDAAVSGLKPGERIVLDGRQNLRPGATVVERAREGGRGASGAAQGGAASSPGRAPSP